MVRDPATLTITSSLFGDGETIPHSFVSESAGGENLSPDLAWSGEPADTSSFAITVYDPDAPTPRGFAHWVLFNLKQSVHALPTGAGSVGQNPLGSTLGLSDFGTCEYGGMAPPVGDDPHHYRFQVYALDVRRLDGSDATTYDQLHMLMRGHVLGEGMLTGLFGRHAEP